MRFHGKLKTWNDERGFGFIQPQPGNHDIFVHISAFPRDGQRPRVGEALSFEIKAEQDGKKCAIKIARAQLAKPRRPSQAPVRGRPHGSRRSSRLLGAAVAIALGAGALQLYSHYAPVQSDGEARPRSTADERALPRSIAHERRRAPQPARYHCDGRVYCSEMSSCAEARFFLSNCPGVKMDGDFDGEPCEQQWCN